MQVRQSFDDETGQKPYKENFEELLQLSKNHLHTGTLLIERMSIENWN